MISVAQEQQIVDLLRRQTKQRVIARTMGVPRCVVARIAAGERPATRAAEDRRAMTVETEDVFGTGAPPERCPTCGARVFMPCQVCLVRQWQQRKGLSSEA